MFSCSNKVKGVLCLVGAFCLHLFFGCLYLWGNISVYITSYLNKYNDAGISLSETFVVFPIMITVQAL
jgi:hypothetical protein